VLFIIKLNQAEIRTIRFDMTEFDKIPDKISVTDFSSLVNELEDAEFTIWEGRIVKNSSNEKKHFSYDNLLIIFKTLKEASKAQDPQNLDLQNIESTLKKLDHKNEDYLGIKEFFHSVILFFKGDHIDKREILNYEPPKTEAKAPLKEKQPPSPLGKRNPTPIGFTTDQLPQQSKSIQHQSSNSPGKDEKNENKQSATQEQEKPEFKDTNKNVENQDFTPPTPPPSEPNLTGQPQEKSTERDEEQQLGQGDADLQQQSQSGLNQNEEQLQEDLSKERLTEEAAPFTPAENKDVAAGSEPQITMTLQDQPIEPDLDEQSRNSELNQDLNPNEEDLIEEPQKEKAVPTPTENKHGKTESEHQATVKPQAQPTEDPIGLLALQTEIPSDGDEIPVHQDQPISTDETVQATETDETDQTSTDEDDGKIEKTTEHSALSAVSPISIEIELGQEKSSPSSSTMLNTVVKIGLLAAAVIFLISLVPIVGGTLTTQPLPSPDDALTNCPPTPQGMIEVVDRHTFCKIQSQFPDELQLFSEKIKEFQDQASLLTKENKELEGRITDLNDEIKNKNKNIEDKINIETRNKDLEDKVENLLKTGQLNLEPLELHKIITSLSKSKDSKDQLTALIFIDKVTQEPDANAEAITLKKTIALELYNQSEHTEVIETALKQLLDYNNKLLDKNQPADSSTSLKMILSSSMIESSRLNMQVFDTIIKPHFSHLPPKVPPEEIKEWLLSLLLKITNTNESKYGKNGLDVIFFIKDHFKAENSADMVMILKFLKDNQETYITPELSEIVLSKLVSNNDTDKLLELAKINFEADKFTFGFEVINSIAKTPQFKDVTKDTKIAIDIVQMIAEAKLPAGDNYNPVMKQFHIFINNESIAEEVRNQISDSMFQKLSLLYSSDLTPEEKKLYLNTFVKGFKTLEDQEKNLEPIITQISSPLNIFENLDDSLPLLNIFFENGAHNVAFQAFESVKLTGDEKLEDFYALRKKLKPEQSEKLTNQMWKKMETLYKDNPQYSTKTIFKRVLYLETYLSTFEKLENQNDNLNSIVENLLASSKELRFSRDIHVLNLLNLESTLAFDLLKKGASEAAFKILSSAQAKGDEEFLKFNELINQTAPPIDKKIIDQTSQILFEKVKNFYTPTSNKDKQKDLSLLFRYFSIFPDFTTQIDNLNMILESILSLEISKNDALGLEQFFYEKNSPELQISVIEKLIPPSKPIDKIEAPTEEKELTPEEQEIEKQRKYEEQQRKISELNKKQIGLSSLNFILNKIEDSINYVESTKKEIMQLEAKLGSNNKEVTITTILDEERKKLETMTANLALTTSYIQNHAASLIEIIKNIANSDIIKKSYNFKDIIQNAIQLKELVAEDLKQTHFSVPKEFMEDLVSSNDHKACNSLVEFLKMGEGNKLQLEELANLLNDKQTVTAWEPLKNGVRVIRDRAGVVGNYIHDTPVIGHGLWMLNLPVKSVSYVAGGVFHVVKEAGRLINPKLVKSAGEAIENLGKALNTELETQEDAEKHKIALKLGAERPDLISLETRQKIEKSARERNRHFSETTDLALTNLKSIAPEDKTTKEYVRGIKGIMPKDAATLEKFVNDYSANNRTEAIEKYVEISSELLKNGYLTSEVFMNVIATEKLSPKSFKVVLDMLMASSPVDTPFNDFILSTDTINVKNNILNMQGTPAEIFNTFKAFINLPNIEPIQKNIFMDGIAELLERGQRQKSGETSWNKVVNVASYASLGIIGGKKTERPSVENEGPGNASNSATKDDLNELISLLKEAAKADSSWTENINIHNFMTENPNEFQ